MASEETAAASYRQPWDQQEDDEDIRELRQQFGGHVERAGGK
jgi:hypothetical protein